MFFVDGGASLHMTGEFFHSTGKESHTTDQKLPKDLVNTTPHTSYFHIESHAPAWLKFGSALTHPIPSRVSCERCVCLISSTTPFTSSSSPSSLISPSLSFCPSTSSSRMWWTNTLRTYAEDLGTLAENEPPTDPCREWLFPFHTEATVSIQELGTQLYVLLVEDSPSVLSLGRLFMNWGVPTLRW